MIIHFTIIFAFSSRREAWLQSPLALLVSEVFKYRRPQVQLCGSRKYPYPPWKVTGNSEGEGGGGLRGRNFQGEWGVHGKLLFPSVKKQEKIVSNAGLIPSTK